MKLGRYGWLLCLSLIAVVAIQIPRPTVHADSPLVIISELAWAGSSLSSQDEWIELRNVGSTDVDISNWSLTKDTGSESAMVTIPLETVLPSGAFFVISNYDNVESVINIEPDLVDNAVTLSNSKLLIRLYDADGLLQDTAGDGGVPPAGNNTSKSSMERDIDLLGWHDAAIAVNLDPAVSDLATPGAENSSISLPPTVSTVTPVTGIAGEQLVIEEINGDNFDIDGVVIKLVQNERELVANDVSIASSTLIDNAVFDIEITDTGVWSIEVTNPDGQSGYLGSAITISEPEPEWDLNPLVRLNELYPRPGTSSSDEFIELINLSDKTVILDGWELDDEVGSGSARFKLDGFSLPARGYLTFYKTQSKITLNDSGDEVHLFLPTGDELDIVVYESAPKAQSWAKNTSNWEWTTTPTANGNNIFTQPEIQESEIDEEEEDLQIEPRINLLPIGSVVITELYPDPLEGEQEFIELLNISSKSVSLEGVFIEDAGGKRYKFMSGTLNPDQRLVIYRDTSGIALNNTGGEEISLLNPDGTVISKLSYPDKAPISAAFIRLDNNQGTWVSVSTPGTKNPTDLIEIEREVGAWVDSTQEENSLPVTGIPGFSRLGLLFWILLVIISGYSIHERANHKNS
ncbi:MAG: lamin tail domain-containing protein [Patescibacteria group bacterium]